jgi:hypothetical protein
MVMLRILDLSKRISEERFGDNYAERMDVLSAVEHRPYLLPASQWRWRSGGMICCLRIGRLR